jgi:hypothetical protein
MGGLKVEKSVVINAEKGITDISAKNLIIRNYSKTLISY